MGGSLCCDDGIVRLNYDTGRRQKANPPHHHTFIPDELSRGQHSCTPDRVGRLESTTEKLLCATVIHVRLGQPQPRSKSPLPVFF